MALCDKLWHGIYKMIEKCVTWQASETFYKQCVSQLLMYSRTKNMTVILTCAFMFFFFFPFKGRVPWGVQNETWMKHELLQWNKRLITTQDIGNDVLI